jgi:predicted ATPase
LHAEIAEVLEKDLSERATNESEAVAYHYTAAGIYDRAATYWLAAAEKAHQPFANIEAVGHARNGLEALKLLPPSNERDQQELRVLSVSVRDFT